jgi:type IV pilus assembly protein PilY1
MRVAVAACTNPTASSDEDCADRYMKWEIGVTNGSLPNRVGNVFGDIYHSTPVIVEKPSDLLRDEAYTDFAAAQSARPSMIYTATNDGQLHAFKIARNPADTSDSFDITSKANNEIWSFFPPAVLPRLQSQYSSTHQILLDGPAVVKDVIFARSANDAKGGVGAWHTVLVAGYGAGGTGYYAIDITNPIPRSGVTDSGPKFLWQLTTDAAGKPLFGKRSGKPVITSLFFDPAGGSSPQEYAVAILPGGESDGPIAGSCPIPATQPIAVSMVDNNYGQRANVRCWAPDPARSVTIVRIDTGEIIRSFRNAPVDGPLPNTAQIVARSKNFDGTYPALAAPMTGEPVVYPATTGTVADRAFIGDRDGMLWRINLASSKPAEWTIGLFFDAFPAGQVTDGQPIATPPIISVDQTGNLTVAFSTGDQETLLSSIGMTNYLWSLRENVSGSSFKSKVLWYSSYTGGKRVTGPMQLFNSILYYTTFTPVVPNMVTECTSGDSQLCGVHYINPKTNTNLSDGGYPSLVDPASAPSSPVMVQCIPLGAKTMAFGPGLVQKPTCSAETTFSDPYLGYGQHSGLSNATGSSFQLVVQTGTGGTAVVGGATNVATLTLKPPINAARIDSWAAVIE